MSPTWPPRSNLGGAKPTSADVAADRFGAHVEAIDELAALDGVESVAVESWWAIALYPEMDPRGRGHGVRHGNVRDGGSPAARSSSTVDLPGVDDANAVTINEEAAEELGLGVGSTLTFADGLAGPASRVGDQRRSVRLAPTPSTDRRSRSTSPPSPDPTADLEAAVPARRLLGGLRPRPR